MFEPWKVPVELMERGARTKPNQAIQEHVDVRGLGSILLHVHSVLRMASYLAIDNQKGVPLASLVHFGGKIGTLISFNSMAVDPLPLLAPVSQSPPFWPKSSFSSVDPTNLIKPWSFH